MIEFAKLMLFMNDTAKDYIKDGKPTITEEQFTQEFQRREKTCFYPLKWSILWKYHCFKFWFNHSVLCRPFEDEN